MRGSTMILMAAAALSATVGIAQQSRPEQPADPNDHAAAATAQPDKPGDAKRSQAEQTRSFLGLGVQPDAAAAARGKPAYAENCAGCHGAEGRGGIGPNLLYSSQLLDDDHGEKLGPWLKVGRPEKGMPAFATLGDRTLTDITEFLHLQVENYANRGTYENTNNIMTGDLKRGAAFFKTNCTQCHSPTGDMKGVGARFRPLDLQRNMIVPSRENKPARGVRAIVTAPTGNASGRLTKIDDFDIVIVDDEGKTQAFRQGPAVKVVLTDPLQWHQRFAYRLKDSEMTDLVTYLGSLK